MLLKRFKALESLIKSCIYSYQNHECLPDQALMHAHSMLRTTKKNGGIVYVIGNGGSAGIASHFSIDLLNTLEIPSNTLYDSNIMSCISNDYGYEHVFSNPLKTLGKPQDLLVAISSSGSSPNILNTMQVAKEKKMQSLTFSGFESDNPLRHEGTLNYYLEKNDYGLVEMGHFFLAHTIIDTWKFQKESLTSKDALLTVGNAKQN